MAFITYTSILIIAFRSGIVFVGVTPENHLELIRQHDLDFRPVAIMLGYSEAGEKRLYITYNARGEGETPSGRTPCFGTPGRARSKQSSSVLPVAPRTFGLLVYAVSTPFATFTR